MNLYESIKKNIKESERNHPTAMDKKIIKIAKKVAKKLEADMDYNFEYSYDVEDDVLFISFNGREIADFFDDRYLSDLGKEIDITNKTDDQIEKILTKAASQYI